MRKAGIILVALVIGFVLGAGTLGAVKGIPSGGWTTGNKYLSMPENIQHVYIAGVSDACLGIAAVDKSPYASAYSECIRNMGIAQIDAIAKKYLKEHPEEWHFLMAGTILRAVTQSCLE